MKGLFLFILSCISFCIVVPPALLYGLYKGRLNFFEYAVSVDQTIHAISASLLDALLLRDKTIFKFGDMDKTISYNIGKNSHFNNLSKFGVFIDNFLNAIDKDHTKKAFEDKI